MFKSWGCFPLQRSEEVNFTWIHETPEALQDSEKQILPVGLGRSYGDSCLNEDGVLLKTDLANKVIAFNSETGVFKAESGISLAEILDLVVPKGWFLPVTPGTKFITLGGAVANDVHGKNHHRAGTFGSHVKSFELLRTSGERLICSPEQNSDLFSATIAGLGLTGLITWVEIQLVSIDNAYIDMDSIKFESFDEFLEISSEADKKYEFTVSWLDCVSRGEKFGRGIFMGGNPSIKNKPKKPGRIKPLLTVPFPAPELAIGYPTMKIFNTLFYGKQFSKSVRKTVHYEPFYYPLDIINRWNLLYGRRGFFQFQCVLEANPMKGLLKKITESGAGSFLSVVKEFGDIRSPGMLSFPRPGITLALDFANRGERTIKLLKDLDTFVRENNGAIYPAKDAIMDKSSFQSYFPNWSDFSEFIDPKFSSSFWRRVAC